MRKEKGFVHLYDFGHACGWHDAQTYKIISGEQHLKASDVKNICNILSCSADELLRTNKYKELNNIDFNSPVRVITHALTKMDTSEQIRLAVIAHALSGPMHHVSHGGYICRGSGSSSHPKK